jgi:D-amino-acid dehydrogenase
MTPIRVARTPASLNGRVLIPALKADGATRWVGRRPATPDSLPVIGCSPRHRAVLFAFGHRHLGLAFAAVTGHLIAELTAARPTSVDISPFRADRFCALSKPTGGRVGRGWLRRWFK